MTAHVQRTVAAAICLVGVAVLNAAPGRVNRSIFLLIDVTRSVTSAMTAFEWDGAGALGDPVPSGSRPDDSPRAVFKPAVSKALKSILADGDRVLVGSVSDSFKFGTEFESRPREIEKGLDEVLDVPIGERQGNSRLWDALVSGVSRLANEPGPRLLVMVSDGMATGNTATVDDVVRAANEAHVAISIVCEKWELRSGYGFAIRDRVDGPWFLLRSVTGTSIETYLGRLTSRTGGTLVVDGQGGPPALAEKLAAVIGE